MPLRLAVTIFPDSSLICSGVVQLRPSVDVCYITINGYCNKLSITKDNTFPIFLDTKVDGTSQFSPPLVERAVIPFVPTMTNVPLPNTIP